MYSSDNHVFSILVAEFDIDRGASLTMQYPGGLDTNSQMVAELMLPDGAHLRSEDWTIFFLNQKVFTSPTVTETTTTSVDASPGQDQQQECELPLLYVLSLVRTKHDVQVRRGALVKAMAICTRHAFLQVYKPVLLLALEDYFQSPGIDVLKNLYEATNQMDVAYMPKFTPLERQILRFSDAADLFEERFLELERAVAGFNSSCGGGGSGGGDVANVPQPQQPFPLSLLPQRQLIDIGSGQLRESTPSGKNKDRKFFETFVNYNNIRIPIRIPLTLNPEEIGDYSLIKLIMTFANCGPIHCPVQDPVLFTGGSSTHPLILLMNAMLTGKRIIFLGNGKPSGEVSNYVLAACAMGSGCGILRGFTTRAFPYSNLLNVDELLLLSGYIAGVTNSIFESHHDWWDLLLDINTGKITVSSAYKKRDNLLAPNAPSAAGGLSFLNNASASNLLVNAGLTSNSGIVIATGAGPGEVNLKKEDYRDSYDNEFINDLLSAISAHYGENVIRAKFHEYVLRFVRIAAFYEWTSKKKTDIGLCPANQPDPTGLLGAGYIFPDEQTKQREMLLNRARIESWIGTQTFANYQADFLEFLKSRHIKALDVERQLNKLKVLKSMEPEEVEAIFQSFLKNVVTAEQITEFLSYLPFNQGGLSIICLGLFHTSRAVRDFTVEFLERLQHHALGIRYIQGLNKFHRRTFERLCHAY